jgi:hypothetical protein
MQPAPFIIEPAHFITCSLQVSIYVHATKRVQDSSQLCCSISPCHQDLGSKLRGYWFYTKEERGYCKNSTYTQEYCNCERGHWRKSILFWMSPLYVSQAVWSQCSMYFTQRSSLPLVQNLSYALRERDYVNRVNFCQTYLQLINQIKSL